MRLVNDAVDKLLPSIDSTVKSLGATCPQFVQLSLSARF